MLQGEKQQLQLRHYGSSRYEESMFLPIVDVARRNKPGGGLWTSPINAPFGWREWNEISDFADLSTHFDLDFEGRVFEIDSVEDMNKLPWEEAHGMHLISFEPLLLMGYDAIHLTTEGETATRATFPRDLYGWDCETVLVMNKNSIRRT